MQLSSSLVKEFAKVINSSTSESNKSSSVRGTAVVTDGNKYVQLDSSDLLTPISEATDVQNGDRVLVSIENHVATVIGNYSCPASARTASNFMKLTTDGLLIGELDQNGHTKGTGSLIAPGVYYVVDEDGNRLASFASGEINLGDLSAIIRLCGGKCRIYSSDGVMVMYADDAVGLRSSLSSYENLYSNVYGTRVYRAEVICQSKDKDPIVSIQAFRNDDEEPSHISVSRDGIALNGPICSFNGSEILVSNKLITAGTVKVTVNLKAGKAGTFSGTAKVPDGYHLAGVREVQSDNKNVSLRSFYTHPSTNTVSASFTNTSTVDITGVTLTIEWFALYSKGETYIGEDIIEIGDDEFEGGS